LSYINDKSKILIKGSVATFSDLPAASSFSGFYFLVYEEDLITGDPEGVYRSDGTNWTLITGAGGGLFLGWFATEVALTTAHPTASDGNYAIVGATDTIFIWDGDTSAWIDSGDAPPALGVKEDGVVVDAATNELNFTGSISATQTAAGKVDINVPVLPQNEVGLINNYISAYDNTTGAFTKSQPTVDGIGFTTRTVSADSNILLTDNIIYVNAEMPVTLTLTTAANINKKKITIKDVSGLAVYNNIKIIGENSELINNNMEFYINGNYDSIDLTSNGIDWVTL